MKKQEKKRIFKEIETPTKVSLNSEQLAIVRKLIAPSTEVLKIVSIQKELLKQFCKADEPTGNCYNLLLMQQEKSLNCVIQ